jgi:PAS domain S-box-containing protein
MAGALRSRKGVQRTRFAEPMHWAVSAYLAILVAVAYFLAARLSLALLTQPDGVAVFWPAAGVSAGVLIMLGPAARMPVIAGAMAATIAANLMGDRNVGSAIVFGACNAGEAVLVAALLDRIYGAPFNLESLRRVMGLLSAAVIGTATSGVGGTAGYLLFHSSTASTLTIWWHWFASDAIGIITVAPLFIGLPSLMADRPPHREVLEGALALAILTAVCALVIRLRNDTWTGEIAIITVFPLLLWMAARCRPVFTAAAAFVCTLSIVWTTTYGIGIFGDPHMTIGERVQAAQASILAISLCGLVLAALFAERRRQEHTLAENESRLQSALRIGRVTAFDWMVRGDVTERSENAADIVGISPQEAFTAAAFLEHVHPEDREPLRASIHGATPADPDYQATFRYLRPDGHEVWLSESGQVEFDAAGRMARVHGLTRDVTERKRSDAELASARNEAERANRAKTSFLSAASHDLRQPLQSLNLLQSALKRRVQDFEARILINRIGHSLDVMKGILDSLLDVNRVEGGTLVPAVGDFQVDDIFDSVAADFLELTREKNLEWRLVRSRAAVHSDRRMLEVMIRNLLSNAVRYTERGRILLGCRRSGDKLRIEVWDSGIGIRAEHIPRIFEEYYQAEGGAHSDGYGLGLAIVERLGRVLGHAVQVRSIIGKGSGFSIELPMACGKAAAPDQSALLEADAPPAFRGTILVVEDDSFVRAGLESLLKSEQIDAVSAANANEALTLVAQSGIRPDLILSDFNLRGSVDGIECIDAVRAVLKRKIPAIVLTGEVRSKAYERIEKHDVGVALKPFNADELLRLINRTRAQSRA